MKKKYLFLILSLLNIATGLRAQEAVESEQLLVYRNTGVVDLLYTNKVDSILTNDITQVFYAKDTVLVVPLAELDSVAVGNRNEMVFYKDVKELNKSEDLPWIIRFDGESIFYRNDTPSNILPSVGMKLFYGMEEQIYEDAIFPFGLSVKVTNVTKLIGETRVDVERVDLGEIFERLFLAGHFLGSTSASRQMNARAPINVDPVVHRTLDINLEAELEDIGSIGINGNLNVDGDAVVSINPFNRYYHVDLYLTYGLGMEAKLGAKENTEIQYEDLGLDQRLATFYRVLNLDAAIGAFADLTADLNLGVEMNRTYRRRLIWNRKDDTNTFEFKEVNEGEPYKDEAKIDLTLNGELFFGPILKIDFATVGGLVGARAKLKFGPKIEGEISLAMIQQMTNYQPEFYGNASLNVCSQVALEGFVITRDSLFWGEVREHPILSFSFPFAEHEWKLFPDYTQSSATATTTKNEQVVTDVATAVKEPTPTPLETGFILADSLGNVVDSVFVGKIASEKEMEIIEIADTVQTFTTMFELPPSIKQKDMDGYTMCPIFKYAGYTIRAAPVDVKHNVLIQPYTATMSNGAMTFISSGPFLGSAEKDSTLYLVGAYLPVAQKNNVYKKGDTTIKMGKHIDSGGANNIVGTWQGMIGEKQVTLILKSDYTGSYDTSRAFKYELNIPQSGDLQLTFDNGETLLFRVLSVTENELKIEDKRQKDSEVIVLEKISQE